MILFGHLSPCFIMLSRIKSIFRSRIQCSRSEKGRLSKKAKCHAMILVQFNPLHLDLGFNYPWFISRSSSKSTKKQDLFSPFGPARLGSFFPEKSFGSENVEPNGTVQFFQGTFYMCNLETAPALSRELGKDPPEMVTQLIPCKSMGCESPYQLVSGWNRGEIRLASTT